MVIDPELRSAISGELQSGEKVLWVGKPTPLRAAMQYGEAFASGIFALVALIIVLTLFSGIGVFNFGFFGLDSVWVVLIFVLLTAYYFARPFYEYLMARRTIYAITDRRALIVKPNLNGRRILSYNQIERIERQSLPEEKGDLVFGSETYTARGRYGYRVRQRKIGFFGIDNARKVEELMLQTFTSSMYPDLSELT